MARLTCHSTRVGCVRPNWLPAASEELDRLHSVHSSPLQRARRTAEAISTSTGLPVRLHRGLAEMDFGQAEGLTLAAMSEQFQEIAERFRDLSDRDVRWPGGGAQQLHDRVRTTLDHIVTTHAGERLVVVAHGGVIASLAAQILGDDQMTGDVTRSTIAV